MLPIAAYLNNLSFAPGDQVDVKVGSFGARTYRADLRRIIQGDKNPEGPGYRDEAISLDLGGDRVARQQALLPGSYILIQDRGDTFSGLSSFTIAVPICPTRLGDGRKTIISFDDDGPEIALDIAGCLTAKLGEVEVTLPAPLTTQEWSVVVVSFAAETKILQLACRRGDDCNVSAIATQLHGGWSATHLSQMMIAARQVGRDQFDGKIDSPALFDRAIAADAAIALIADPARLSSLRALVGYWDFTKEIDGPIIRDASPNRLDGEVFQCPARAMTGWRWRGEALDWRVRPDLYSAIHFHADDMSDAGWDTDFGFTIPVELRSGIYAVRLVPDGAEADAYHCVFALRPSPDKKTGNAVCYLMPTASYLAYANHRLGLDIPGTEVGMGRMVEIDRHHGFLQSHPEVGFSFYEVHGDGSGVFYSSRNRPIVDLQPGVKGFLGGLGSNVWQFNADTHITGWMESRDIPYDVITDEDLHRDGLSLLKNYRVVVTGTHPEYYSLEMLDTVQGFVNRGGRLMYLGGNGFYWRISFSEKHPGVIECRRSEAGIRPWEPGHGQFHHAFTGEYGGLWRRNGRPSSTLTGLTMTSQGFDISEPYVLSAGAKDPRVAFMFEGLGHVGDGGKIGTFGLSGGGAAGLEIDRADDKLGTPSHAIIVGSSTRHTDIYLMTPEDLLDPTPDMTGTQSDLIRADLVFFEVEGGGAVFSTGSIAWAGAMAWNRYDNEISRLTENVLRRFSDATPFCVPQ